LPITLPRRTLRWNRDPPGLITIAAVAVAIALLPLPGEYYVLLRLFLCGVSAYFLTRPRGVRDAEKWVLVGLIVLHNPIAPLGVGSKLLWSVINIATVAWFWRLSRRPGVTR
jgi:hypothetical protein